MIHPATCIWLLFTLSFFCWNQPSGRLCRLPAHCFQEFNNSPFLCASDAIAIVFQSGKLVKKYGVAQAARILLVYKHLDSPSLPQLDMTIAHHAGQWNLRFVAAVGSLSAFIKVLGMKGVPWVTALATMYASHWLIMEAIIFTAWSTASRQTPALGTTILANTTTKTAAEKLQKENDESWVHWFLGVLGYFTHLAILTVYPLDCSRFSASERGEMERNNTFLHRHVCMSGHTARLFPIAIGTVYSLTTALLFIAFLPKLDSSAPKFRLSQYLTGLLTFLSWMPMIIVAGLYSHWTQVFSAIVAGALYAWYFLNTKREPLFPRIWGWVFAGHTMAEAIVIFSKCINAVNTSRGDWTEWLG